MFYYYSGIISGYCLNQSYRNQVCEVLIKPYILLVKRKPRTLNCTPSARRGQCHFILLSRSLHLTAELMFLCIVLCSALGKRLSILHTTLNFFFFATVSVVTYLYIIIGFFL